MAQWTLEYAAGVRKQLKKMGRPLAARILDYMDEVAALDNPRSRGKRLTGDALGGLWRYRVEDHRIICELQDARLVVLVLRVGRRDSVYGQST